MNAIEQFEALKLTVGAKPGQIVLGVDLSEVQQPSQTLELLTTLGFTPQIRYVEFTIGLHVFALLKDEQHEPTQAIDDDYLMAEWELLVTRINPDAVHLWRGAPRRALATA